MSKLTVKKLGKADVIIDIVPKGNPEIRPGYAMKPTQIAVHNTGNSGRGANAKAHNTYIHNMAKLTPKDTGYASWHFSCDDKFIYQHIVLNETAWHTGDGSGSKSGNMTAIGIEICEDPDTDTHQAEENAIALIVHLMKEFNIPLAKVKPHQDFSGKYCPRVILKRDGSFDAFSARVKKAYEYKKPAAKSPAAKIHTVVSGDTLWGIGKKYDLSVDELKEFNTLKSDVIHVGQVLRLEGAVIKESGIKQVGAIQIVNLNNFTYIYDRPSSSSKVLDRAYKGATYPIAGSVVGWFEIIHEGKRAYVSSKYSKRI